MTITLDLQQVDFYLFVSGLAFLHDRSPGLSKFLLCVAFLFEDMTNFSYNFLLFIWI